MSTYKDLQDEVLTHQLSDTKYRPYVKQILNEAQRFIYLQTELRTQRGEVLLTTVAGTENYEILDDDSEELFSRIISVGLPDSTDLLTKINLRDYDDSPVSSGKPQSYVIVGNNIYLQPTPDSAYDVRLRFWRLPVTMTDDTDTPELPERYHHLLVRYTLARCFERENDYEAAAYWRAQFQEGILLLRTESNYQLHDQNEQVPGIHDDELPIRPGEWI